MEFDERFSASLGDVIWWCTAKHLRCVDAVELQPLTISLEEVL